MFLGVFAKLQKATTSFVISACRFVRMEKPTPTGRVLMKFDIWFCGISVKKIKVSLKYDENNEYITWRRLDIYKIISLNSSKNEKCFK